MRKSKIIKIDDLEITIKELRVRDVLELSGAEELSLPDRVGDMLSRCTDIKNDQLLDMTPSEVKLLLDGFMEVNKGFLDLAAVFGLDDLPGIIRQTLRDQFALSLQQDTEQ